MTQQPPFQASVMFATFAGAAGFVVAVQAWTKFRGSPFGRVLAVLPPFMLIIALYHPILLIFPEYLEVALLIESAGFGLLVIFVGLMLRVHRRMRKGVR